MLSYFLLCNFYNCRQYGIFQSLDDAKKRAFELYYRSRIKSRYLLWHVIEAEVGSGKRLADYYYIIEPFSFNNGTSC